MPQLEYDQPPERLAPLILRASLPPLVAIAAWPVLYFTLFLTGLVAVFLVLILR